MGATEIVRVRGKELNVGDVFTDSAGARFVVCGFEPYTGRYQEEFKNHRVAIVARIERTLSLLVDNAEWLNKEVK